MNFKSAAKNLAIPGIICAIIIFNDKVLHRSNYPSSGQLKEISFIGTWREEKMNPAGDVIFEYIYDVTADGVKFRNVRHREGFDDIKDYDGVCRQEKMMNSMGEEARDQISSFKKGEKEIRRKRFWARNLRGDSFPSEIIAGRSSVYFSIKTSEIENLGFVEYKVWRDEE